MGEEETEVKPAIAMIGDCKGSVLLGIMVMILKVVFDVMLRSSVVREMLFVRVSQEMDGSSIRMFIRKIEVMFLLLLMLMRRNNDALESGDHRILYINKASIETQPRIYEMVRGWFLARADRACW